MKTPFSTILSASCCFLLLPAGCSNQHQAEFHRLHTGMTQTEVRDVLGEPTTTFYNTAESRAEVGGHYQERWQYGDTISTRATGAFFPEIAPNRVWVVFFDTDGRVTEFREPLPDEFRWEDNVK